MTIYRPLKILHVTLSLSYGGTEKIVVDVANSLSRDQFSSTIACMDRVGERAQDVKHDVPIYLMHRKPGITLRNFYLFYKLVTQIKPHIIHFRNFTTYFWGCGAARLLRGSRIILSDNSGVIQDIENNNRKKILARRLFKHITDGFLTNSFNFKHHLVECTRLKNNDVVVIPNGVDTNKFYPLDTSRKKCLRLRFGFKQSHLIIGTVASLRPVKNLSLAIRAMNDIKEHVPSVRLILAGDGEQEQELKELVKSLGLEERVVFLGAVKEINDILNIFDLFVFTSKSAEGMPNALLEAMAARVPVVASNIPGNAEALQGGKTGLLFENNDKDSLVRTILTAFNNPELRNSVAERAYQHVHKSLNLQAMVRRYAEFYHKLYYGSHLSN